MKTFFADILTNPVFLTSASAFLISQIIKAVIDSITGRRVRAFGHGGMPSSHSATALSLAVITGLYQGFSSSGFAISFIVAFIVMSDAAGVRRETAKHTGAIKKLADRVSEIGGTAECELGTGELAELIGHTPLEVFFGAVLGLFVAVSAYFIMKIGFGVIFYY